MADITDTRLLELVNSDYPISGVPDSRVNITTAPTVAYSFNTIDLHEKALEAVEEMFAAARKANIKSLYVCSGYRDYATQKRLYEEATDKSFVQPPNHSEHQTGLAVDIMAGNVSQEAMGSSREGRWLAENSWKYGLILRYAADKQDITGIACEPWHFRYVGQPHAWYCRQNGLCMEEYIQFLREGGGYSASYNGVTYTVLWEKAGNGRINVPEEKNYIVSSDNRGGYIVTAWE